MNVMGTLVKLMTQHLCMHVQLEATQRENKLVKQLAGVLAFEPQALLEQASCAELDKYR